MSVEKRNDREQGPDARIERDTRRQEALLGGNTRRLDAALQGVEGKEVDKGILGRIVDKYESLNGSLKTIVNMMGVGGGAGATLSLLGAVPMSEALQTIAIGQGAGVATGVLLIGALNALEKVSYKVSDMIDQYKLMR